MGAVVTLQQHPYKSMDVPARHDNVIAVQNIPPGTACAPIGVSNTTELMDELIPLTSGYKVELVDCAISTQVADNWAVSSHPNWTTADSRLLTAGYDPADVSMVWVGAPNLATDYPAGLAAYHTALKAAHESIRTNIMNRYTNAVLILMVGINHTNFWDDPSGEFLPAEYAVAHQLVMDEMVAEYSNCEWGPNIWNNGPIARADGFNTLLSHYRSDGVHLTTGGSGGSNYVANWIVNNWFQTHPIGRAMRMAA